MTRQLFTSMSSLGLLIALLLVLVGTCYGDDISRAAIAAHQDQLQNLVLNCDETKSYDIDPADAAKINARSGRNFDLKRAESLQIHFDFLNGNVSFDRTASAATLKYWSGKGLPTIQHQIQIISSSGRIEEFTTQSRADGRTVSFGGIRQIGAFAPDAYLDIAMGLRLLGSRQWLTDSDFAEMSEIPQSDNSLSVLQVRDGTGRRHELTFDRHLLFALIHYKCTNPHGDSVEIINSGFHRYGNVFIPGKIERISNLIDKGGRIRHPLVYTMTVNHASIGDPKNQLSNYAICWPPNMRLFDARTSDAIDVGPTARTLSDEDIRSQLALKAQQESVLESIAQQRIRNAVAEQPATRP